MLELVDFYKVLQVDPSAEPEVIQAAYRSLARKYHPDVVGGSEERMVAINQAWAVLGDDATRAVYDRSRSALRHDPPPRTSPDEGRRPVAGPPPGPPSGTVLEFGRYSGWSFGQIARHDPDFLEWLARMPIGRPFRAEIDALLSTRGPVVTTAPKPSKRRRR
jgi:curved DNA-binding protein CbpA